MKTDTDDLDVAITLTERGLQIDAGSDLLGRWTAKDFRFERLAPSAYELRFADERVHVQVADDRAFHAALALIRQEQGVLVPRPLLWVGVAAIAAATMVSAVMRPAAPAQAEASEEPVATSIQQEIENTVTTSTPLAEPVPVAPPVTGTAPLGVQASDEVMVERWNQMASGSVLEVDTAGENHLPDASVTIANNSINVEATPTGTGDNAETIMAALGLAIATADPTADGPDRAAVLEDLGLRTTAVNNYPIQASVVRNGVEYTLDYEPGVRVVFGAEWG